MKSESPALLHIKGVIDLELEEEIEQQPPPPPVIASSLSHLTERHISRHSQDVMAQSYKKESVTATDTLHIPCQIPPPPQQPSVPSMSQMEFIRTRLARVQEDVSAIQAGRQIENLPVSNSLGLSSAALAGSVPTSSLNSAPCALSVQSHKPPITNKCLPKQNVKSEITESVGNHANINHDKPSTSTDRSKSTQIDESVTKLLHSVSTWSPADVKSWVARSHITPK